MNLSLRKQFVVGFVAAGCLVATACGGSGSAGSEESNTTSATTAAGADEGESEPTTTPEVAPPTTGAVETVPPTTEPVDPCADFNALLGYERMMAVKDGTAPTDAACKPAVDRSTLALNTYEAGLAFSEQFANTDPNDVLRLEYCDDPVTLTNVFEVPVIYWGISRIGQNDVLSSYEPFVSDVLLPGASWIVPIPGFVSGDPSLRCGVSFEGIVAPTGGLAAGIDGAPAAADDPLASDDYQVWGPALFDQDTDAMTVAEYVNRIEDIHSNDVGNHVRDLESGETDAAEEEPAEDRIVTFCGSEPADLGADVAGTYAWLVYAAQLEDSQRHSIGLFSRGADNRWRFVGTVVKIDDVVDPGDPCKLPPRSVG